MPREYDHPRELIDPEGEGIYIRDHWALDMFAIPGPLHRAAYILLGTSTAFRDLDIEAVWMGPSADGETYERKRFRWWHGFMPERWWPFVTYLYCRPKPEAM